jgi:hypothetical protein
VLLCEFECANTDTVKRGQRRKAGHTQRPGPKRLEGQRAARRDGV